ncbi:hypothetical protein [Rhizobium sp. AAP43]|uniref:hypothetical protein n=1 Tax=Rhizobium sp. AAP43 TaxID=1523420 RepID=UPI0006B9EE2E|nr:hypothetical protein [Rhizobium sp. AAP43]KPF46754.1 hypothetical protein IP76_02380 [Rhizobium sp. AAP43]
MTSAIRIFITAICLLSGASMPVLAASSDAWDDFAKDVAAKCTTLAEGRIETPQVVVDPFGTENYGVAILTGKAFGADAMVSSICVYDKKAKTAEIGGELTSDMVTITVPKP